MPRKAKRLPAETLVQAAREITTLDQERADRLEAIAEQYGCLPQVQAELDHLRADDRFEMRLAQLQRTDV